MDILLRARQQRDLNKKLSCMGSSGDIHPGITSMERVGDPFLWAEDTKPCLRPAGQAQFYSEN